MELLKHLKDSKPQQSRSEVLSGELTELMKGLKEHQERARADTKAEINKKKRDKRKLN